MITQTVSLINVNIGSKFTLLNDPTKSVYMKIDQRNLVHLNHNLHVAVVNVDTGVVYTMPPSSEVFTTR